MIRKPLVGVKASLRLRKFSWLTLNERKAANSCLRQRCSENTHVTVEMPPDGTQSSSLICQSRATFAWSTCNEALYSRKRLLADRYVRLSERRITCRHVRTRSFQRLLMVVILNRTLPSKKTKITCSVPPLRSLSTRSRMMGVMERKVAAAQISTTHIVSRRKEHLAR